MFLPPSFLLQLCAKQSRTLIKVGKGWAIPSKLLLLNYDVIGEDERWFVCLYFRRALEEEGKNNFNFWNFFEARFALFLLIVVNLLFVCLSVPLAMRGIPLNVCANNHGDNESTEFDLLLLLFPIIE